MKFDNVTFKKVIFENVTMDLCHFENVKIKDCIFKHVTINNSSIPEKILKELHKQDVTFENMNSNYLYAKQSLEQRFVF